jgi:membrane protein implicated in regulation of membrane protease activity
MITPRIDPWRIALWALKLIPVYILLAIWVIFWIQTGLWWLFPLIFLAASIFFSLLSLLLKWPEVKHFFQVKSEEWQKENSNIHRLK